MVEKKKYQVRGLVTHDVILHEFEAENLVEAEEIRRTMEFPNEYNDDSAYVVSEDDDEFEGPAPYNSERPYLGD